MNIMDADDSISLPAANGKHLKEDLVGANYKNYDFFIVFSHFNSHAMGGFGGAINNMSISIVSSRGKNLIHSASTSSWGAAQDDFLEFMAEATQAVANDRGDSILFINVLNKGYFSEALKRCLSKEVLLMQYILRNVSAVYDQQHMVWRLRWIWRM